MSNSKSEHAGIYFLLAMAVILPFAAWYGFVIKTLWGWFAVPLGAVHVGVWEAAGIHLLVRLLTFDSDKATDSEKSLGERLGTAVATGVLVPAMSLGFAAIYHGFAS